MTPRPPPFDATRRRARVAYELARVKLGVIRAVALAIVVAAAAFVSFGHTGLAWLILTAGTWTAIEWRGGALLRGGRTGASVGLAVLVLPHWAFRTCCHAGNAMMGADCCSLTGACAAVGLVAGLTLAVFLVRMPRATQAESALGMGLALLAVASVRCASLIGWEALGLMGGLAAGAAASSLVAIVVDRARHPA
jgi:hypothetical protein